MKQQYLSNRQYYNVFFFIFLVLGAFPVLKVAGFGLPVQYLFLPNMLLLLLMGIMGQVKMSIAIQFFFAVWVILFLEVILSSIFGPLFKFNILRMPTDGLTYLSKMAVFLSLAIYFYNFSHISGDKFLKFFLFFALLAMLIGLLQWLPWGGAEKLTGFYTYKDKYVNFAIRDIVSKRIPGVSGMATSNGGISAFFFTIALSTILYGKKNHRLSWAVIVLSVFNVFASQARMGYLTLIFSGLLFYLVWIYTQKQFLKPTLWLTAVIGFTTGWIIYLYTQGNAFLMRVIFRWLTLGDQIQEGGNRIGQVKNAFGILDGPYEYLFGISRFVQQSYESLFIEVEPVNIFVMYGALGFIIQYALVFLLLGYLFSKLKKLKHQPLYLSLAVSSFIGLFSYQFFSAAYFFFRETRVGLIPWIFLGVTIGTIERQFKLHKVLKSKHMATNVRY